jgi:hypothetical protein
VVGGSRHRAGQGCDRTWREGLRKPPMRAYPSLPKEDLDAIVAYMLSLKKK